MNCEPGDLALWKRRGVLVKVGKRYVSADSFTDITGRAFNFETPDSPAFVVNVLGGPQESRSIGQANGRLFRCLPVYDRGLIPIRDQPGADETLTWKPVPQPVPEKEQA
jgi:hypothetical protein